VPSEFDIAWKQARTDKEKALTAKALRQATGKGGGGKARLYTPAEMNTATPEVAEAMRGANEQMLAKKLRGGQVTYTDVLPGQTAGREAARGNVGLPGFEGIAPPPELPSTAASDKAIRAGMAASKLELVRIKDARDADTAAVREGRLERAEAMRRDSIRVQAAGKVDIFSDPDLLDAKNEILRGAMLDKGPAPRRTYDIKALRKKFDRGEALTPDEAAAVEAEANR